MSWHRYHHPHLYHPHPHGGVWTPRGSRKYAAVKPESLTHSLVQGPYLLQFSGPFDDLWPSVCQNIIKSA